MFSKKLAVLTFGVALALTPSMASAQGSVSALLRPRLGFGIVAGATQFDLSGTGTTGIVGARLEAEMRRWLVAEGALGFFLPAEQGGTRRHTVAEGQLQLQLPLGAARPYVGAGGGLMLASGSPSTQTASAATGMRLAIPSTPYDVRAELRVRGIGSTFSGSTAEWTLGATYRF